MIGRTALIPFSTVVIALVAGCAKPKEKEAEPVLPVQLAEVQRASIVRAVTAEGILRAVDQSAVMPKISAPVKKFYVNRGDHVHRGQLLAELESRDLAAAVVDAKGAYNQASAAYRNIESATVPDEVVKAQQDVDAARQSLEAAKKLLQSREQLLREGALARRMVDEAGVAYAQAKSQHETAQKHLESLEKVGRHEEVATAAGQLESAKGKYEAAQAQLSYAEIRSPISGVVADRTLFAGEIAAAGTPLLTIIDISSVIARVNVPPAQAVFLKIGQSAVITASDGAVEAPGKVTVVSPAVDPNSTTVEVWVQAANQGERLRPGGTVKVTISAGGVPGALLVPVQALLPGVEGGTSVMVVAGDFIAHERKVQVGLRDGDRAQLIGDIKPGEKVVVGGGVGLQDGAKVTVAKPVAEGAEGSVGRQDAKADKNE